MITPPAWELQKVASRSGIKFENIVDRLKWESQFRDVPDDEIGDFSRFLAAGLSVVPIEAVTKKTIGCWAKYQADRLEMRIARRWDMHNPQFGLGVVCGPVSGFLEVMDFDDPACFPEWFAKTAHITSRLPIVETPSGGFHCWYRCTAYGRGATLAKFSDTDTAARKMRIETKAEGNLILAPCRFAVHRSGNPYVQISGPVLPTVPTITPEARKELRAAARSFDRSGIVEKHRKSLQQAKERALAPKKYEHTTGRPSDIFNQRMTWFEVLEPAGWRSHNGSEWTRPGKESGVSAKVVLNGSGEEMLKVFTSSCQWLEAGERYSKFEAFAELYHSGDWGAAAKAAKSEGLI